MVDRRFEVPFLALALAAMLALSFSGSFHIAGVYGVFMVAVSRLAVCLEAIRTAVIVIETVRQRSGLTEAEVDAIAHQGARRLVGALNRYLRDW